MTNLNYLFNVEYYKNFPNPRYTDSNKKIVKQKFSSSNEKILFTKDSFVLKTMYPGLLSGLGNTHEAGSGKEFVELPESKKTDHDSEIRLGFNLDYVTGLPMIFGSTVKGVLNSAFQYYEYIEELLDMSIGQEKINAIREEIFGHENMGKVIFYDAIPIKTGKNQCLLGLENITPHNKQKSDPDYQYNGLLSPNIITLLKVIPGVSFIFRFGFDLWDEKTNVDILIKKEKLLKVFKNIVLDLGIGAKTNTGFGAMEEIEKSEELYNVLVPCQDH